MAGSLEVSEGTMLHGMPYLALRCRPAAAAAPTHLDLSSDDLERARPLVAATAAARHGEYVSRSTFVPTN